jgi:hypothetical protein
MVFSYSHFSPSFANHLREELSALFKETLKQISKPCLPSVVPRLAAARPLSWDQLPHANTDPILLFWFSVPIVLAYPRADLSFGLSSGAVGFLGLEV